MNLKSFIYVSFFSDAVKRRRSREEVSLEFRYLLLEIIFSFTVFKSNILE